MSMLMRLFNPVTFYNTPKIRCHTQPSCIDQDVLLFRIILKCRAENYQKHFLLQNTSRTTQYNRRL